MPDCPPGVPELARPKTSLSVAPSTWMLLKRLLRPPTDEPLLETFVSGESRAKSASEREMVGSDSMFSSPTLVEAPVRSCETTDPDEAVISTSPSAALSSPSVKPTVCTCASARSRPVRVSVRYPTKLAVTVYGPPTRRPRRS